MNQVWQPLLANMAVIAVFTSFWVNLQGWLQKAMPGRVDFIFGLLCGVVGLVLMLMPVQIAPGIFIDLRSVVIIMAGFFSGPFGGVIAGAITGGYRLWVGGPGALPGITGIVVVIAVGIFLNRRHRNQTTTFADIVNLAFAGVGSVIAMIMPISALRHDQIYAQLALPHATLIFTSIILAGSAIMHENRRREAARANEIYGAVMDALPDCLNARDPQGRFLVANPATAALMGAVSKAALIGKSDADFYDPDTAAKFREDEERIIRQGRPETLEQRFVRRDGKTAWLWTLKVPFPNPDGEGIGIITHNRDITAQKQLELELRETQIRLSDALTHMADGLVMFGGDGRLVYSSDRFRRMFSIPDSAMLTGTPLRAILQQAVEHFKFVLPEGVSGAEWVEWELDKVARLESTEFQLSDGRWFQNRHAAVRDGAWLTVFSDITERKKSEQAMMELNARLEILAHTDGMTGLANRKTFDDKLYAEFARSQRHGNALGLMLIDVDRFKAYNDIYGHPEGDACLKVVAECLKRAARRPSDIVARYGGEEFVALFPETDEDGMHAIAEQFHQSVRDARRVHVGAETGVVTVSIGVAVMGPEADLRGPGDLLRAADQALYHAKGAGRDCVRFADMPALNPGAEQKAS